MTRTISAALAMLVAFTLSLTTARAVEDTWDYSVQVSSSVQVSPAKVTLTWPQDTNGVPSSYTIYRKAPGASAWGSGTTLPGSATGYTDTSVSAGAAYEYRIVKAAGSYTGYGYIQAGVAAPLVENRGKVVLVVDSSIASSVSAELTRLQQDLAGDGWIVVRRDVSRTDSPTSVKAVIKAAYDADPANVKSVFLFGHVPVPYSGQLNPDGHADHIGAWPADVYYGDMDGTWTDNSVNFIQTVNTDPADAKRLTNVPGDGKFDQTTIPAIVKLEVGRVDLANMPGRTTWGGPATFASETELLRKYLNKDHNFRHHITTAPRRAILGDYFGARGGEAFAASGFRSFAPLVGASNIRNLNIEFNDQKGVWIPQAAQNDYLLAYGCGAGGYTGISGLGNTGLYNEGSTTELVSANVRGVFNLLFGSWLGDWDHEDDILRAPLATDSGLVSVWSGRPHWFIHPLGAGETIGYTAKIAMNNNGLYETQINSSANRIHIALMGDPTLRLHPVAPVSNLNGSVSGNTVALTWSASTDSAIVGYHVYRGSVANGFTRLTSSPVTATNFSDTNGSASAAYMVRAIKFEDTTSGSYSNPSQGVFWNVGGTSGAPTTPPPAPVAAADTTAPTVALSAPAANATLSGASVSVTASASDAVGVAGVQFKLDGANLGAELSAAPFTTTLDTTALANGSHTLSAVARDAAGNQASATTVTVTVNNVVATTPTPSVPTTPTTPTTPATPTTPVATTSGTIAWFDDALPANAGAMSNGDTWNWVSSSPAPFSGSAAHKSDAKSGFHEHSFNWATPFAINVGDTLVQYVYLDPANTPSEIMLSWGDSSWEHRAYWGSNDIPWGTDKSAGRFYMGALPAAGQWVRLEIPASAVALEGSSVAGMSFALFNGAATWDLSGKAGAAPVTTPVATTSTVTVTATDANALIGSTSDTALVTFTRTGSTASDLTVGYTLAGTANKWVDYRREFGDMPVSITIPAGATSASMKILAISTAANGSTAIFKLAADSAYTVGTDASATLTFSNTSVATPTTPVVTVPATPTDTGSGTITLPFVTPPVTITPPTTAPAPTTPSADALWFDDQLPLGAGGSARGGDAWTWVASSPAPFSGSVSHQSALAAGLHEHQFNWATQTMKVNAGESLFLYVYIDPANKPSTLMISWCASNWEHRAYWGANNITYGVNNSAGRRYMGPLPAAGGWVRLEVPASAVDLEGATVNGMDFTLYDGRATFDRTGTTTASSSTTPIVTVPTTPTTPVVTVPTTPTTPVVTTTPPVLVVPSTSLPPGTTVPAPSTTPPTTGANVVTVVATDAFAAIGDAADTGVLTFTRTGSTASAITVNFNLSGSAIKWVDYRRPEGDMPVTVTIPAGAASATLSILGKANSSNAATPTVIFTLTSGTGYTVGSANNATVTLAKGTTAPVDPTPTIAVVTVVATDAIAVVNNASDNAVLTFTRNGGDTSKPLVVNFTVGGNAIKWVDYRRVEGDMPLSATIPAGATSATMTIAGYAISAGGATATATFTLSPDAAYTIGSANNAALTIASSSAAASGSGTVASGGSTTPTTPPVVTPPVVTPPVVTVPTTPTTPSTTTPTSLAENSALRLPVAGQHQLRVLTPTTLELNRITSGATDWNFVSGGVLNAPAASAFNVTVNGQAVSVSSVGFRRRVAYGELYVHDLRVENALVLALATAVPEGATVEVKSADPTLIPSNFSFKITADALRYNPAIHVNQEGYVPSFPKKAMIGYYLGNKGELNVDATAGFKLVAASTGTTVYTGTLTARKDVGYNTSPLPYQNVLQADFSSFTTPGEYQLVVPGMGASFPFVIDEGVAMAFERTYAMGLFHQRCGAEMALPYTRFLHEACHVGKAEIPSGAGYDFTWTTIASKTTDAKSNPRHTAPAMVSEATALYPFVNKGPIDVSGGHHDAGDYSKYTINVANLVHQLVFNVDAIPGAKSLDNLGTPNSGDGISDILQEAKHESDFLAKMQDADGGFYFLVYPKTHEYESDVIPGNTNVQVVWPKTTAVTAASVAALAQMASSPTFKAAYPAEAASYLAKAKLGWQFLMTAIAKYGKDGSYQKITHYGNEFMHDDELAWAACEMFLATGDNQYQAKLLEWFPDPSDTNTMRWSWVRLFECYGNSIRSYAFAARTGRLPASALNASYLAACENQIKLAAEDELRWSQQSAYGTSFPDNTKRIVNAGWYFSLDSACDIATAYQINPKPEYIDALVANLNYEGGSNPVNTSFLTGLGLKRQRQIVNQWALNDTRVLPPIGYPSGNIVGEYGWLSTYGSELNDLSFPASAASGTGYVLQDRYSDIWNVTAELVTVNQARALLATTFLATQTAAKSTAWKPSATAKILASATTVTAGQSITLSLDPGINVAGARITWEAAGQEPDFGSTFTVTPTSTGAKWVDVEITYADGRRIFGTATFNVQ